MAGRYNYFLHQFALQEGFSQDDETSFGGEDDRLAMQDSRHDSPHFRRQPELMQRSYDTGNVFLAPGWIRALVATKGSGIARLITHSLQRFRPRGVDIEWVQQASRLEIFIERFKPNLLIFDESLGQDSKAFWQDYFDLQRCFKDIAFVLIKPEDASTGELQAMLVSRDLSGILDLEALRQGGDIDRAVMVPPAWSKTG